MDNKETNSKIDKVELKLDKLDEKFDVMGATLIRQEESLRYHIRRTDLAESRMEVVETKVDQAAGVVKAISLLSALIGLIVVVIKAISYFS